MLDHIIVEANGVKMSLNHVAVVSVIDAQTLSVTPYDPSVIKFLNLELYGSLFTFYVCDVYSILFFCLSWLHTSIAIRSTKLFFYDALFLLKCKPDEVQRKVVSKVSSMEYIMMYNILIIALSEKS